MPPSLIQGLSKLRFSSHFLSYADALEVLGFAIAAGFTLIEISSSEDEDDEVDEADELDELLLDAAVAVCPGDDSSNSSVDILLVLFTREN